MARTPRELKRSYPLPVYNYRVVVEGETMSFSRVTGIKLAYDTVTYRHGLSFLEGERMQTFDFDSFFSVTFERGMALGATPLVLYAWMRAKESRGVEVSLCDEKGESVITWKIAHAVAVKLEAPTFDASSNEVAIERLELQVRGLSIAGES
ncbi:MAG: phage tail protein [Acidobacteriota bacterium]